MAIWSPSHRLTSAATADRPVSRRPTRTGWSNMVRPYSLTGTSAAVNTASTPAVASAARTSMASMRAWGRGAVMRGEK
jgi:hypothetical protein